MASARSPRRQEASAARGRPDRHTHLSRRWCHIRFCEASGSSWSRAWPAGTAPMEAKAGASWRAKVVKGRRGGPRSRSTNQTRSMCMVPEILIPRGQCSLFRAGNLLCPPSAALTTSLPFYVLAPPATSSPSF
jgi:hypothetical protein